MLKKGIIFTLLVLVSSLVVWVLCDKILQTGLLRSNEDIIGKMNELIQDTTNYDVVCLGSSRTLAHIDPRIITEKTGLSTYNAGFNGAIVFDFDIFLKLYLEKRQPPKFLVMHIDSASFHRNVTAELPKFFPFISNDIIYNGLVDYEKPVKYIRKFPPLRIFYYDDLIKWVGIKSLIGISARSIYETHNGFSNSHTGDSYWNGYWESLYTSYCETIKKPYVPDSEINAGLDKLISIMELCKRNNTRVILTSSPIVEGDKFVKYDVITSLVEKITAPYHPVYFWKHGDPLDRRLYYYNYTHMTYRGAEHYTNGLADLLNQIKADPDAEMTHDK